MLAAQFKRTKIVATIGPASNEPDTLRAMIEAGVNGLRLNFAHGTHDEHAAVIRLARGISRDLNKPVAIIADLAGPKLRAGQLPAEGLPLVRGQAVRFSFGDDSTQAGVIPVQYDFSRLVKPGQQVLLRDGAIVVEVTAAQRGRVSGTVLTPGILFSRQGVNLPEADFGGDILTDKDLDDLKFIGSADVDYVSLSFVQRGSDIDELRARLKKLRSDAHIIAKIETRAAIADLPRIIATADAVMVARGDLAAETEAEAVPLLQRRITQLGRRHQTPVIVATQMLESMINSPQPTRAEVSDVATAVMEGADAVMTSGETAVGHYPVETIKMMKRVVKATEEATLAERQIDFGDPSTRQSAVSAAAIVLARQMGAKAIIAKTTSGQTARNLSSYRPSVPIIMVTADQRVAQQLAIVWGGKAYLVEQMAGAADRVMKLLKAAGNVAPRDAIVVAKGHQPNLVGGTDTVEVRVID